MVSYFSISGKTIPGVFQKGSLPLVKGVLAYAKISGHLGYTLMLFQYQLQS